MFFHDLPRTVGVGSSNGAPLLRMVALKTESHNVDYSSWKSKQYSVNRLRLDPENPRLATAINRPTQQQLIADLLMHEHVLDLMKDIAKNGFFPNDQLVAFIDDSNNLIVVEGNRRLAALKLLLNPQLAPDAYRSRVEQVAAHCATKIDKVLVSVAPSRTAAVPILIARHDGNSVRGWSPIMQARFVQSRIENGLDVSEVAEETGLDRSEVVRRLRDAKLYDVIRSIPLSAEVQPIVNDARKFPFTTLRRLIEYSSVQDFLGMKVDDKRGFVTTLPDDRFTQILARIVSDIATEKVTSRSHNTNAEVEPYVKSLEQSLGKLPPNKSKKVTPADEFIDPVKISPPPPPPKRKTSTPSPPKPPIGLIPKSFRVAIQDDRIEAIVQELKELRIDDFPNAVAVLFRSLLDMAVTKYVHETPELQTQSAALAKRNNRPIDWAPTLKQHLSMILQTSTVPLPPEGRKSLTKFVSDTTQSLTLEVLNWFTHVRYVPPTVEQLRSFWTMLTPLIELTLTR